MKIKNILALGLITVVSGISTAQTYNATAGTNGTTDIQSDYSMATGDGASVSVDVPLEFELPKKVALALNMGSGLPANPMFDGISHIHDAVTGTSSKAVFSRVLNIVDADNNNVTDPWIGVTGGIYANTDVSISFDATDFLHETDSNSVITRWSGLQIGKADGGHTQYLSKYDNSDSSTSILPYTKSIDNTVLSAEGNKLSFLCYARTYVDTIDPTDRAGKYISTTTITVSTL